MQDQWFSIFLVLIQRINEHLANVYLRHTLYLSEIDIPSFDLYLFIFNSNYSHVLRFLAHNGLAVSGVVTKERFPDYSMLVVVLHSLFY